LQGVDDDDFFDYDDDHYDSDFSDADSHDSSISSEHADFTMIFKTLQVNNTMNLFTSLLY
jgi:hypothetical protein